MSKRDHPDASSPSDSSKGGESSPQRVRAPSLLPTHRPSHLLELFSEASVPTERGAFRTVVFREKKTGVEHVALVKGEVKGKEGVPVRIHSECLTSEVFGSLKCDCRAQLDRALDFIAQSPCGALLYLRQEGRGIGLGNKIRAYALQNEGLDTYDANRQLGFPDDLRRYDIAAEMIRALEIRSVDLITNNPLKIAGLVDEGVPVRRRISLKTPPNPHNEDYLKTKRDRSGHLLDLPDDDAVKKGTGRAG